MTIHPQKTRINKIYSLISLNLMIIKHKIGIIVLNYMIKNTIIFIKLTIIIYKKRYEI